MDNPVAVNKPEVRRDHAHLNPLQVGWRQPLALERPQGWLCCQQEKEK